MNDADDSAWMSAIDELGDEWIEDDLLGSMYWEAARHRRQHQLTTAADKPGNALSLLAGGLAPTQVAHRTW